MEPTSEQPIGGLPKTAAAQEAFAANDAAKSKTLHDSAVASGAEEVHGGATVCGMRASGKIKSIIFGGLDGNITTCAFRAPRCRGPTRARALQNPSSLCWWRATSATRQRAAWCRPCTVPQHGTRRTLTLAPPQRPAPQPHATLQSRSSRRSWAPACQSR